MTSSPNDDQKPAGQQPWNQPAEAQPYGQQPYGQVWAQQPPAQQGYPGAGYPPPQQAPQGYPAPQYAPAGYPPAGYPPQGFGPTGYGRPPYASPMEKPTGWFIVNWLFFWPTAIYSLVSYWNKIDPAAYAGDLNAARYFTAQVRKQGIIALCIFGGLLVFYVIVFVVILSTAASTFPR